VRQLRGGEPACADEHAVGAESGTEVGEVWHAALKKLGRDAGKQRQRGGDPAASASYPAQRALGLDVGPDGAGRVLDAGAVRSLGIEEHHRVFDLRQRCRHTRCREVRDEAEGLPTLGAVPAPDHETDGPAARVATMPAKTAAPASVQRAARNTGVLPGTLGNVRPAGKCGPESHLHGIKPRALLGSAASLLSPGRFSARGEKGGAW